MFGNAPLHPHRDASKAFPNRSPGPPLEAERPRRRTELVYLTARHVERDPVAHRGMDPLERQVDRDVRLQTERARAVDQEIRRSDLLDLADLVASHPHDVHAWLNERSPG